MLHSNRTELVFLFLCFLLQSCADQNALPISELIIQASLDSTGPRKIREKVQNLISLADCKSYKGSYLTEIHSDSGGYSYFKQTFHFRQAPFEAIVLNGSQCVLLGDSLEQLGEKGAYMVRGHDFPMLILQVNKRFHDFEQAVIVGPDSVPMYQIKAKDEQNHPCTLFFDKKTSLFVSFSFQNPANEKDIILTRFSNRKIVQGLLIPFHVEINQGGKLYTFDYRRISFNNTGFEYKQFKK